MTPQTEKDKTKLIKTPAATWQEVEEFRAILSEHGDHTYYLHEAVRYAIRFTRKHDKKLGTTV